MRRDEHGWRKAMLPSLIAQHFVDRLVVLLPEAWGERRDRGLAHAERGNTEEAVADLEVYLAHAEDGLDIDLVADRLHMLRNAKG